MDALSLPPLSLYIHIPWCVKKCPYCDFNSHELNSSSSNPQKAQPELPIQAYLDALKHDIDSDAHLAQGRLISSIFFGGGTPSLFPNWAIKSLLEHIHRTVGIAPNAEITLEANPGTTERDTFDGLLHAGVNRLSLGIQSFNNTQLSALGRIHSASDAGTAFKQARQAGFDNINIDLMHGLPEQSCEDSLQDLATAIDLAPEHLSWYQLTIEPNTHFYSQTPLLPHEDTLGNIQEQGHALLQQAGFEQYETSAYSQPHKESAHNTHYWHFDDYLAIGAGAHGKISFIDAKGLSAYRFQKTRLPEHYLQAQASHPTKANPFTAKHNQIEPRDLPLEFMMNALRLTDGVDATLFEARTGTPLASIASVLRTLQKQQLLTDNPHIIGTTPTGHQYLNSVLEAFMPN